PPRRGDISPLAGAGYPRYTPHGHERDQGLLVGVIPCRGGGAVGRATFDAPAVLAAVEAGQTPSDTCIFAAKWEYFIEQGSSSFAMAGICGLIVGLVGFVLGQIITHPSAQASSILSGSYETLFIIGLLVIFLLALTVATGALVIGGIVTLWGLRTWRT